MTSGAAGLWIRLEREADRLRPTLGPRTLEINGAAGATPVDSMVDGSYDAVLAVGAFGGLGHGPDPETRACDLVGTIGEAELWFVDITRRSGSRGRLLDAALRAQSGGTQQAVDVTDLLRRSGWIVLDLDRTDLTSLSLPFPQLVVGRAVPREKAGYRPHSGV